MCVSLGVTSSQALAGSKANPRFASLQLKAENHGDHVVPPQGITVSMAVEEGSTAIDPGAQKGGCSESIQGLGWQR